MYYVFSSMFAAAIFRLSVIACDGLSPNIFSTFPNLIETPYNGCNRMIVGGDSQFASNIFLGNVMMCALVRFYRISPMLYITFTILNMLAYFLESCLSLQILSIPSFSTDHNTHFQINPCFQVLK